MERELIGVALTALILAPSPAVAVESLYEPGFPRFGSHEVEDYCYAKAVQADSRCTLAWCGSTLERSASADCRSYCFELVADEAVRCIPDASRTLGAEFLTAPKVDVPGCCRKIYGQVRDAWVSKGLVGAEAKNRFEKSVAACEEKVRKRPAARAAAPSGT
jgi:hypothetical protein